MKERREEKVLVHGGTKKRKAKSGFLASNDTSSGLAQLARQKKGKGKAKQPPNLEQGGLIDGKDGNGGERSKEGGQGDVGVYSTVLADARESKQRTSVDAYNKLNGVSGEKWKSDNTAKTSVNGGGSGGGSSSGGIGWSRGSSSGSGHHNNGGTKEGSRGVKGGIGGGGSGWGISRSTAGKKRSKSSSGGPGDGPAHPFPTDYCDHFETPLRAYRDAEPVLVGLAAALGKARAELQIWDPFFCAGRTPRLLAQLGFTSVHHENVDFYEVIRQGAVPPHDVFVTNPPYSGNHKRRCLEFCAASGKPWLLLMPNYVATKDYYRSSALTRTPASATGSAASAAGSASASAASAVQAAAVKRRMVGGGGCGGGSAAPVSPQGPSEAAVAARATTGAVAATPLRQMEPFYVVPTVRYDFDHPAGTGHEVSPFASMWFVQPGRHADAVWRSASTRSLGGGGGSSSDGAAFFRTLRDLESRALVPTMRRGNPKQRKRARQAAAMQHGAA